MHVGICNKTGMKRICNCQSKTTSYSHTAKLKNPPNSVNWKTNNYAFSNSGSPVFIFSISKKYSNLWSSIKMFMPVSKD